MLVDFVFFIEIVLGVFCCGIVGEFVYIARIGGVDALFAGWGFRVVRAVFMGVIVLVVYEVVKMM